MLTQPLREGACRHRPRSCPQVPLAAQHHRDRGRAPAVGARRDGAARAASRSGQQAHRRADRQCVRHVRLRRHGAAGGRARHHGARHGHCQRRRLQDGRLRARRAREAARPTRPLRRERRRAAAAVPGSVRASTRHAGAQVHRHFVGRGVVGRQGLGRAAAQCVRRVEGGPKLPSAAYPPRERIPHCLCHSSGVSTFPIIPAAVGRVSVSADLPLFYLSPARARHASDDALS